MTFTRNRNPYASVDWASAIPLTSCTHVHCVRQPQLDNLLANGMDFFILSNYYPSTPYYPLKNIRENSFRMGQPGYCKGGKHYDEYVDFTPYTGIKEAGAPLFQNIPENLLEAPNAEHHWFADHNVYLHITAPGAQLTSGHFDNHAEAGLVAAGYQLGLPVPWREGFKLLLDSMIYPDGGGIVIAHPQWSHHNTEFINEMLDFDQRVLGMEIVNYGSATDYTDACESLWDEVLRSGRQCYGFCVQDHTKDYPWRGRIIILAEERTPRAALKALREGRFYGAITGEARFEYIRYDGHTFSAACDQEVSFQLISSQGVEMDHFGKSISFEVPEADKARLRYLRLDARLGRRQEKLYSQPIWLV